LVSAITLSRFSTGHKTESASHRLKVAEIPKEKLSIALRDASRTLKGQAAILSVTTKSGFGTTQFPESYQTSLAHYLSEPAAAIQDPHEDLKMRELTRSLRASLVASGMNRASQAKVFNRLGKHFYNQSILGFREGLPRPLRIKYLKLSIAHLEEGRL
jgi:hypothetical protein